MQFFLRALARPAAKEAAVAAIRYAAPLGLSHLSSLFHRIFPQPKLFTEFFRGRTMLWPVLAASQAVPVADVPRYSWRGQMRQALVGVCRGAQAAAFSFETQFMVVRFDGRRKVQDSLQSCKQRQQQCPSQQPYPSQHPQSHPSTQPSRYPCQPPRHVEI